MPFGALQNDLAGASQTNMKVNNHNSEAFANASFESKCTVPALDSVIGDVTNEIKLKILQFVPDDPSKTMGLFKDLHLAIDLPAEISINVDVEDGLTNGNSMHYQTFRFSSSRL